MTSDRPYRWLTREQKDHLVAALSVWAWITFFVLMAWMAPGQ